MMSTAGNVVFSSSSRSPISVSSSSSATSSVQSSPWGRRAVSSAQRGRAVIRARTQSSTSRELELKRLESNSSLQEHPRDGPGCDNEGDLCAVGDEASRGPYVLVYVTPSTTHQFISLSSAASFLRSGTSTTFQSVEPFHFLPGAQAPGEAEDTELHGGYWRLGYVVCSRALPAAGEKIGLASSQCWCFTLEALPEEQLLACRAVLTGNFANESSSPSLRVTPVHSSDAGLHHTPLGKHHSSSRRSPNSHHRGGNHHDLHHQRCAAQTHAAHRPLREYEKTTDMPLHDVLVTPLYVCTNAHAVVPLTPPLPTCVPELEGALTGLSHAAAGYPVDDLGTALSVLARAVPSAVTLVYSLRQRHQLKLPLLSLLNNSRGTSVTTVDAGEAWPVRGAGTEVYLTLGSESSSQESATTGGRASEEDTGCAPHAQDVDETQVGGARPSPWSALVHAVLVRCAQRQRQIIVFQGCSPTSALLRRNVISDLTQRNFVASTFVSDKVVAAAVVLDALTPPAFVAASVAGRRRTLVSNAVELFVTTTAEKNTSQLLSDNTVKSATKLELVGGRVRRTVAVPGSCATSPHDNLENNSEQVASEFSASVVPEPDAMSFPWFLAFADSEMKDTLSDTTTTTATLAPPLQVTEAVLVASMQTLGFSAELQTHIRQLTRAVVRIASLSFVTRHGTVSTSEAAMLSADSIQSCELAGQLLQMSPLELVQVLTTVEVPSSESSCRSRGANSSHNRRDSTSHTARHALNCAGACQMQSVLVAHLAGVLVRTLLQAVNNALQEDTTSSLDSLHTHQRSTVSLALHNGDAGDGGNFVSQSDSDKLSDETVKDTSPNSTPSVMMGGLQDWHAAYARLCTQYSLCARLVDGLRHEARCEGVEREVDTWVDTCGVGSAAVVVGSAESKSVDFVTGSMTVSACVAEDVKRVARRVPMPDVPAGASLAIVERVAAALDTALARSEGREGEMCASTVDAVQGLLTAELSPLVEECKATGEGGAAVVAEKDDNDKKETERGVQSDAAGCSNLEQLSWVSAQYAQREKNGWMRSRLSDRPPSPLPADAQDRTCLRIAPPGGVHPPLYLSLPRLAAELLAVVRLRKIGATAAVQRVVAAVALRSEVLLLCQPHTPSHIEENTDRADCRAERDQHRQRSDDVVPQRSRQGSRQASWPSVTQAVRETLSLRPTSTDEEAGTHGAAFANGAALPSLTVVQAIPVTTSQVHRAASIARFPFMEPLVPPGNACAAEATIDDTVLRTLQDTQPLWLGLFLWSQLCHTVVVPVVEFGRSWGLPLLVAHALQPDSPRRTPRRTPRTASSPSASSPGQQEHQRTASGELAMLFAEGFVVHEGNALLRKARALQREARFRALTLLALTTVVPLRESAVLGVSCVFLTSSAAREATQRCAVLRESALRCLQRVGRGWRCRRTLTESARRGKRGMAFESHTTNGIKFISSREAEESCGAVAAGDGDGGACKESTPAQPPRVLSQAELQARQKLEDERDATLQATSALRTTTLAASAAHLRDAVSALQRGWTTTLELLESELTSAVNEINNFETQRRAAEDAARQEARTRARVTEEAYAEAWADEVRRRQHHHAVVQAEQRRRRAVAPSDAKVQALLQEEERLACITTRHLAELRRSATTAAEAAVLARVVAGTRREDARWHVQHLRRQEQRLEKEAELREERNEGAQFRNVSLRGDSLRTPLEAEMRVVPNGRIKSDKTTPARPSGQASPVPSSTLQYSDARGLVFTRPRLIPRTAAEQTHVFSPSDERSRVTRTPIASIHRTPQHDVAWSEMGDEDADWEVQRDLMALWESSRMTV